MQVAVADWVAARKWGLVKLTIQFSAPSQPAQLQETSTVKWRGMGGARAVHNNGLAFHL